MNIYQKLQPITTNRSLAWASCVSLFAILFGVSCLAEAPNAGKAKVGLIESKGSRFLSAESPELSSKAREGVENLISRTLGRKIDELGENETIKVNILLRAPIVDTSQYVDFEGGFTITPDEEFSDFEIHTSAVDLFSKLKGAADTAEQVALLTKATSSQIDRGAEAQANFYKEQYQLLLARLRHYGLDDVDAGIVNDDEISVGVLQGEFTARELLLIKAHGSLFIQRMDPYYAPIPALYDSVRETRMDTAHSSFGYYGSGKGVNVYLDREDCPDWSKANLGKSLVPQAGATVGWRGVLSHSTKDIQSLFATAPNANVSCWEQQKYGEASYENWNGKDIVTRSLGVYSFAREWASADTVLERKSLNKRVLVFNAAGNGCDRNWYGQLCAVRSPARGHNVVTVGAYNHRDGTMAEFSDYLDPDTGAMKPEIVAPGKEIRFPLNANTYIVDSGTSFSGPLAAGLTASYLSYVRRYHYSRSSSGYIFLNGSSIIDRRPAVLKASILAMSSKDIDTSSQDKDGVGAIQWNPYGSVHYVDSNLNDYFTDLAELPNARAWKLLKNQYIGQYSGYDKVRIAVTWLNDIDSPGTASRDNRLALSLALRVEGPFGRSYTMYRRNNAWQMISFNPSRLGGRGNYKIYLYLHEYSSEQQRLHLGYRMAYIKNQD